MEKFSKKKSAKEDPEFMDPVFNTKFNSMKTKCHLYLCPHDLLSGRKSETHVAEDAVLGPSIVSRNVKMMELFMLTVPHPLRMCAVVRGAGSTLCVPGTVNQELNTEHNMGELMNGV